MRRDGLEPAAEFFAPISLVSTPAQTILPVFFGQADACLVTRRAFLLASELNPQVAERLTVLFASPPLGGGVIAFRPGYPDADKQRLISLIVEFFSDDVRSRQLMTLFGRRMLVPFRPEYLESVKSLLREHHELAKRLEKGE